MMRKIKLFVFCILVIFCGTFSFRQHDYHVIYERSNITFCNTSYLNITKLQLYYVTRYNRKMNLSVDVFQDLDSNLMTLYIEGRKYQSNEYRLFPFNYSENVCDNGRRNAKFGNTLEQFETNFTPNCLIKKGHYYLNKVYYDDSKFPPYAPRGRYQLRGRYVYKKKILLVMFDVYIEIKAQNPLERTVGV